MWVQRRPFQRAIRAFDDVDRVLCHCPVNNDAEVAKLDAFAGTTNFNPSD